VSSQRGLREDLAAGRVATTMLARIVVRGVPVLFQHIGPEVMLLVDEADAAKVSPAWAAFAKLDPQPFGGLAILGRAFYDERGCQAEAWSVLECEETNTMMTVALSRFWSLVDCFGAWASFKGFLANACDYDVAVDDPLQQPGIGYYWLVGRLNRQNKAAGVSPCGIYSDAGVFVRPEDKLIPVFSNPFFAEAAAHRLAASRRIELQPAGIECLGCFLSGYSGQLGRKALTGALLDYQWAIRFLTCAESPGLRDARHFILDDGKIGTYALAGCAGKGVSPIWCERRWDKANLWFDTTCHPRPW